MLSILCGSENSPDASPLVVKESCVTIPETLLFPKMYRAAIKYKNTVIGIISPS